jgi:hypothetical protein
LLKYKYKKIEFDAKLNFFIFINFTSNYLIYHISNILIILKG